MRAIISWILVIFIGIALAFMFDGQHFVLRCVLIFPFSYLATKETQKLFKK
jgi:hypothetical protein